MHRLDGCSVGIIDVVAYARLEVAGEGAAAPPVLAKVALFAKSDDGQSCGGGELRCLRPPLGSLPIIHVARLWAHWPSPKAECTLAHGPMGP